MPESLNADGSQTQSVALDSKIRSLTDSQVRPAFRTGSHANLGTFAGPQRLEAGAPLLGAAEPLDSFLSHKEPSPDLSLVRERDYGKTGNPDLCKPTYRKAKR